MEKSCSGKEGHPSSWVNLSKNMYEKKFTPLPEPRADCCSYCPSLNELIQLGKSKGPFHSAQNSGKFWLEIKWNRPFRFGLTGVFGTTLEGGGVSGWGINTLNSGFGGMGCKPHLSCCFPRQGTFTPPYLSSPRCINGTSDILLGGNPAIV